MNNPLRGENSLTEALNRITSVSHSHGCGTEATPLEAVALARKEVIKAKVQLEDMHGKWKRSSGKLAAAVFLWEALHLKQYEQHSSNSPQWQQLLWEEGDLLLWAHVVSLALALYLMAGQWLATHKRLKVFLTGRKAIMTLLFLAEVGLFAANCWLQSNADLAVAGEEKGAVAVGNPHRHYPFAGALYAALLGQDVYMSQQQAQSYRRFAGVNRLYRELEKKVGAETGSDSGADAAASAASGYKVDGKSANAGASEKGKSKTA